MLRKKTSLEPIWIDRQNVQKDIFGYILQREKQAAHIF